MFSFRRHDRHSPFLARCVFSPPPPPRVSPRKCPHVTHCQESLPHGVDCPPQRERERGGERGRGEKERERERTHKHTPAGHLYIHIHSHLVLLTFFYLRTLLHLDKKARQQCHTVWVWPCSLANVCRVQWVWECI